MPNAPLPRLVSVIGSRPEIIQAAPLSVALASHLEEILVHTGQHYDDELSGAQILDTRLPVPRHNLGVGSSTDAEQLALGEERVGAVLDAEAPHGVLVRGDTNATLAAARAAVARNLPLFHVEAGLRSYREDMPEERNRVQTDRLSHVLFAPTESARANLEAERVGGVVHVTGDVLCDMLTAWRERVPAAAPAEDYLLATVHRNYNTDDPQRLSRVLACLARSPWPVVMPLHPRTRERIERWKLDIPERVRVSTPVPYTEMLALERGARAIATDSGGVVREAYLWGVPCVTLREETEWVETVQTGWNTAVGADPERFAAALARPRPEARPPIFGDGQAAGRIAALTAERLQEVQGRAA